MNNYKRFTVAAAFLLAIAGVSAVGCGDGGSVESAGGAVSINASQLTADITVKFNFPEYKTVEPDVQSFEFSLYDEDLQLCFSRTVQRSEFRQGSVTLTKVPVEAKSLICLMKDKYGNPIGLTESLSVELTPGDKLTIANPDYASTAAELGERLSSLAITPQTPVTLKTGERTHFEVEGTFFCKNGVELPCELTECSRLVWESSNNSVLRSLGKGGFKALAGGSVKVYASIGQKQCEADVIVRAAAQPQQPQDEVQPSDGDADPATAADPEPIAADTPCTLSYDLSAAQLPAGLSVEVRGYDVNNQLRFRRKDVSLKETFEDVDQSVTKLAGVMLKSDGQVQAIFLADVDLRGQKSCTVSDPEIIAGAALASRGEMIITTDKAVYDLSDYEVYNKTDKNERCVKVYTDYEVRYNIIPGVWGYVSGGDFLEEYCSFDAAGSDIEDFGVFRFFEEGDYTVSVSYRGITGVFSVKVTGPDPVPIPGPIIKIDLSSSGAPSGATYEVRGYNSSNSLLFSQSGNCNQSSTFEDVDKNITKLIGVIKASNGEPWGMFEQTVSLKDGEVYSFSNPTMLTGQQFAKQKGSLSFSIGTTSYDLKDSGGYVIISTTPSLTYNYGNGWTATFSRSYLRSWNDFALNSSPYLEYSSSSYKYELKAYEENSYRIYASYRGLTSSSVSVTVIDTTPAPVVKYSVDVNFASSGLPATSSLIYCQLFKDGAAVSDEFSRNSASSLSFDDVSSQANGIVIKVKNTSGQLVGLLYKSLSFDSNHKATLSNVSVATGSGMNTYIKSFTATPSDSLKTVGTYVTGSAQAELTFNSGKILQTRNVSTEAVWSSSDMTKGTANNSWKVTRAGESSLRATLGSKYVDLKAYASGTYNSTKYQYGEANLNSKKAVSMAIYTPDFEITGKLGNTDYNKYSLPDVKGSFNGKVVGGTQAAANLSVGAISDISDGHRKNLHICGSSKFEQYCGTTVSAKLDTINNRNTLNFDASTTIRGSIDYLTPKVGQRISGLKLNVDDQWITSEAEVLIADKGNTKFTPSGNTIILSQVVNGKSLLSLNNDEQRKLIEIVDNALGKENPYSNTGKSILEDLRQITGGHEFGFGVTGEAAGGRDGTEKLIVIFYYEDTNTMAYTMPADGYLRSNSSNSNEGEIIYLNTKFANSPGSILCTCAHELKHLIKNNMKVYRDGLMNGAMPAKILEEGSAELVSMLIGVPLEPKCVLFNNEYLDTEDAAFDHRAKLYYYFTDQNQYSILKDSYAPLVQYSDGSTGPDTTTARYGQGLAFLSYIYDVYGIEAIRKYNSVSINDDDFYEYIENKYGAEIAIRDLFSDWYDDSNNIIGDYDVLAYAVSQTSGKDISFKELYEDFCKACLLSGQNITGTVSNKYKMRTVVPGKRYSEDDYQVYYDSNGQKHVYSGNYLNYPTMPTVKQNNLNTSLSASDIVPWSVNYYVTPKMTYSTGTSSSIFGMWGGLTNTFKMMLFNNSNVYQNDIN